MARGPAGTAALRDTVAFAWQAMDARYEGDERIVGHAAGPYHSIDIAAEAPHAVEDQTFCPYKGLASHYDIGDAREAAWSHRAPFEEVARVADLVSFYLEKVTITTDGEKVELAPGQNVISHRPDGNLSVDEIGGIHLAEDAAAVAAQA